MEPLSFDASVFASRRAQVLARVGRPVLLVGVGTRSRNLPMNKLPFRQDSSVLWLTGCDRPDAAALLTPDGRCELFLPLPADDDALWHGSEPGSDQLAAHYGVDAVRPRDELGDAVARVGEVASLAVPDRSKTQEAALLSGLPLRYGVDDGTPALVDALIELRRRKSPEEVAEHRAAAAANAAAFDLVLAATRPGAHERELEALFRGALAARDCTVGYEPILTVRGEVLHNFHYVNTLQAGQLLLLDGGAERASGYGVDVTRAWPVDGRFSARQRAAYEAVLEAQAASIAMCTAGTRYRHVHDASSLVLARFLADEGLLTCSPDAAVESGAHALFFPHGVGHLLGLDVHDLEQFGDRAAYAPGRVRSEQFGTAYLRLDLDLEPGFLVTIEPGFYVVPAILSDAVLRERFASQVDFERAASWLGFGGIRIEDDILVTAGEPENLTAAIPSTVDELEARIGRGPTALERLSAP